MSRNLQFTTPESSHLWNRATQAELLSPEVNHGSNETLDILTDRCVMYHCAAANILVLPEFTFGDNAASFVGHKVLKVLD